MSPYRLSLAILGVFGTVLGIAPALPAADGPALAPAVVEKDKGEAKKPGAKDAEKEVVARKGADKPGKPVRPQDLSPAVLIRASGMIDPWFRATLFRHLDIAKSRGAKLIILEIDSPGGYVSDSFLVAHRMRDIDWAHTVAYVPREALSGAAFLALGCDEIIMGPHARLGDAGPVILGEDALFRHAPEKLVSDLAVQIRTLADAKGRPAALCEAMVNKDLEVFEVTNHKTGRKTFMSEPELRAAADRQNWEQGNLVFESRKDHFFECTGDRAVQLDLASATAKDQAGLQEVLGITTKPEVLEYTWVDTLALVLNWMPVTILLLLMGLIFLYIELHAPGIGVFGILSGCCFAIFFWSRFLGGTADWLEVTLFIGGILCVGIELFATTGTLVAGLSGFLMILASLVMAGQENWIPSSPHEVRSLVNNLGAIAGSGVIFVIVAAFISSRLRSMPVFNRLLLEPPESAVAEIAAAAPTGPALVVGSQGVAATALRPVGRARFGDQSCEVTADGSIIDPGRPVRVVEIVGGRVLVVEDVT